MIAVVMAGGHGTRLWPLSRKRTPKQFLALISERAMVVDCVKRLSTAFEPSRIFISCIEEQLPFLQQLLPTVSVEQFLVEPDRRDSGPAMAYVAARLAALDLGDQPMVFIPTDHAIRDDKRFMDTLLAGLDLVAETGEFADIGVVPTQPLSTLGYTKIGAKSGEKRGVEHYQFLGHIEKPNEEKARRLIASGDYLWHANYYMVTSNRLLKAYAEHAPEIHAIVIDAQIDDASWRQAYSKLPRVSIDHAVTERLPQGAMTILRGEFGWSDIGQFAQLLEWLQGEQGSKTVVRGQHTGIDSDGCLVISRPDKMVATIGVSDLAIIDTADALLICDLRRAGDVKKLVEYLTEHGYDQYL